MRETYLLALDQGTTSTRAILFTPQGRPVSSAAFPFAQHYPNPGWVEHDPEDLLSTSVRALRAAVEQAGVPPESIAAMGITNQRETTLLWEREGGRAVHPAIVWQCRRTAPIIQRLREDGLDPRVTQRTGLVPDAYFSASKITWLLDEEGLRGRAESGELRFGTVDSFLVSQLVEGAPHVTDATNASRTMLFSLKDQRWDPDLL
ncbi:MAG TPA: FGGY family carbohydrate kinase, partial [Candidatus Limnocylindria bacterium]|nr:FGGY family carbohydrate kinase [Candidatus Limnocylindria bacterium]